MMQGELFYSIELDRLDIKTESSSTVGGLHCGDRIEVFVDGVWRLSRVEYDNDWYLCDLYGEGRIPCGLYVRY